MPPLIKKRGSTFSTLFLHSCASSTLESQQRLLPKGGGAAVEERLAWLAHGPFDRGGGALALFVNAKDLLQPVDGDRLAEQKARDQTQTLSPSPDSSCKIN